MSSCQWIGSLDCFDLLIAFFFLLQHGPPCFFLAFSPHHNPHVEPKKWQSFWDKNPHFQPRETGKRYQQVPAITAVKKNLSIPGTSWNLLKLIET